ncbi:MAG TPA: hypothetical protein PLC35_10780, partial [Methanosarcina vacuolata]|nr:hypothetical protein [Methanosarcina vacuolata]
MLCFKHIQWIQLFFLITLLMESGCENNMQTQNKEQAATAISNRPSRATLPAPLNLLSNEPDYRTYRELSLEHPDEMSLEFLQIYSPKWVAKSKDIDAQIAQISDPELKDAQKKKLQAEANPALFKKEAIKAYDMAAKDYQLKRTAFFNAHQNQWVEIAQYYDYTIHNQIVLFNKSIETAASIRPSSLKVDIPVMDKVFSHFKTESQQDIDSIASEKWQQVLRISDPNKFYAGFSQYEIDALVAKDKKNMWKNEEVDLRRSRLMLMVQGDI